MAKRAKIGPIDHGLTGAVLALLLAHPSAAAVFTESGEAGDGTATAQSTGSQPFGTALDTILRDHIASEELGSFASLLSRLSYTLGNEHCRSTLDVIITKSPHASVQLAARFSRAQVTMGDDDATKAQRTAAAEDLKAVIAESDSESTVERATSALFELENLQIGLVAPDIEAEDLDGIAFKLSDYRGKVVVIDFWGDW